MGQKNQKCAESRFLDSVRIYKILTPVHDVIPNLEIDKLLFRIY